MGSILSKQVVNAREWTYKIGKFPVRSNYCHLTYYCGNCNTHNYVGVVEINKIPTTVCESCNTVNEIPIKPSFSDLIFGRIVTQSSESVAEKVYVSDRKKLEETRNEVYKLLNKLKQFPIIYIGNVLKPNHYSHFTLFTQEYLEKREQLIKVHPEETQYIKAILENCSQIVDLPEYRRNKNVITEHFKYGHSIYASLKKGTTSVVLHIAPIERSFWRHVYDIGEIGKEGIKSTRRLNFPDGIHSIGDLELLTEKEVIINFGRGKDLVEISGIILPTKDYIELENMVRSNFGQSIEEASLISEKHNRVMELYLKDGRHIIFKKFPKNASDKFKIEANLLDSLSRKGLSPEPVLEENVIMMDYVGRNSLLDLNTEQLLPRLKNAVEIMVEIEQNMLEQKDFHSSLSKIDSRYFLKRYGIHFDINSEQNTIISPTLFQGHYIINPLTGKLNRIDLENTYLGPAELSLVNMIITSGKKISENDIMKLVQYYVRLKNSAGHNINLKRFVASFSKYFETLEPRVEPYFNRRLEKERK